MEKFEFETISVTFFKKSQKNSIFPLGGGIFFHCKILRFSENFALERFSLGQKSYQKICYGN